VLVAAVLVLAPLLLQRGFALVGDMSFVPFQPWKGEWLGLDGSVPRAVPADAIVSVLTHVVPGDIVQKAILLGSLLLAGLGMLRLLADLPGVARAGGALFYMWNPYVYERLAIGHWGLLVGYAALPWVVRAAVRMRDGESGAGWALLLWLAVAAGGSPTGGVIAAVTAVLLGSRRADSTWLKVLGVAVLVNVPWLVPGLLNTAGTSDPRGVTAFAAASDSGWGLWGSLLGLGEIWKDAAVPGERSTLLLSGLAILLTLMALSVVFAQGRRAADAGRAGALLPAAFPTRRLLLLGLGALLLAGLPGTAPGATALQWLVDVVPGAGLLRDSQKLLAPFVLVVCVGFAILVARVARRIRADGRVLVPALLALVPVALLPSMAWGLSGRLQPATYPDGWTTVRQVLTDADADHDRVLVLPWAAYRAFEWNDDRAALDPAIRFFPGQVVTDEDLVLDDLTVRGDNPVSREVSESLARDVPLDRVVQDLGIDWVLVEKGAPLRVALPAGTVRHDGPDLLLLETNARSGEPERAAVTDLVIIAADAVVLVAVLVSVIAVIRDRLRRRSR
jgi:hypothetical protein